MNTQPDRKDTTTLREQLVALLPYEAISDSGTLFDKLEALCQKIAREAANDKRQELNIRINETKVIEAKLQSIGAMKDVQWRRHKLREELEELTQRSDKLNKDGGEL